MSYIGNAPISAAFLTDTFSGDGTTVGYTMTVAPANTSSIIVAVTGVLQDPSTYSVSGTTLTFSAAPPSGTSNISVRYLGIPASGVTTTAYRTVTNFTATAGQTSFSVPSYTVGYIDVYRNGVRLVNGGTDFVATTGTTVVLNNACTVGDSVVTESFLVSSVLNALPQSGGTLSGNLNLNSTLTLSGSAGTSGQLLQSQGSGAAPVWVTLSTSSVNYLLVAGGGGAGGGSSTGGNGTGGGGAGGYISSTASVSAGTSNTITIGAGGAGAVTGIQQSGSNSTAFGSTAIGGGYGGSGNPANAASGGSGGGAGSYSSSGAVGSGTSGQGNAGGSGSVSTPNYPGGGGGGAGATGSNAPSGTTGGNGGVGLANSISGTSVYYAGGGGGGSYNGGTGGTGGNGGGGNGAAQATGANGTANTGGGGGGTGGPAATLGGTGGSGVVIISYPTAYKLATATGTYTQTTSGSNYVFTFTGSGTITF